MDQAFNNRFEIVSEILKAESDRGCVIVSQALLEEAIENRIKSRLVPTSGKKDKLFGVYAPLGTFSAKIDIAYRIGIITLHTSSYLHSIRDLRNDFAHSSSSLTFMTQSVKDRIDKLFQTNKTFLDYFGYMVKASIVAQLVQDPSAAAKTLSEKMKGKHGMDILLGSLSHREIFEFMAAIFIVALQDVSAISQISPYPDKSNS